jgi:hypothetical protein
MDPRYTNNYNNTPYYQQQESPYYQQNQRQNNHTYGHHSSEHTEQLMYNAEVLVELENVQRFHIEEGCSPDLEFVGKLEIIYFSS